MPDYQLGKIYKIVDNTNNNIYVGSTCEPTLARRLAKHVGNYKVWKNGKTSYTSSYKIIENQNYDIILLENCPCDTKDELRAKERHYIESLKCVNKNIAGRTQIEYFEENSENKKEYMNKYREENSENIKEYTKNYYEENSDKIKEYMKIYREENKEYIKKYRDENKGKIKDYRKQYYEKTKSAKKKCYEENKERIKAHNLKVCLCICGKE